MTTQFYVSRGDRRFGPFSALRLKELAAEGQIQSSDLIWKEGMAQGVPATKVKNLFPPSTEAGEAAAPPPTSSSQEEGPADTPAAPAVSPPAAEEEEPGASTTTDDPESPPDTAPNRNRPAPPPEPVRKRRAVAVRGAVMLSQDGTIATFRKKCPQCGYEENNKSSIRIGSGLTRVGFFCPKCRKRREAEIRSIL